MTIDGTLTGDGHRNRPNRCPRPDDRLDSSRGAWVTGIPTRIPRALNGYDPTREHGHAGSSSMMRCRVFRGTDAIRSGELPRSAQGG